jgi:hypothetical protein
MCIVDMDQVASAINARRPDWAHRGLAAEPCTWLDVDAQWPRPLTTDRASIGNPRSVGVIIRDGDAAEAQLVVYAGGWADADFVRFADDQGIVSEYV